MERSLAFLRVGRCALLGITVLATAGAVTAQAPSASLCPVVQQECDIAGMPVVVALILHAEEVNVVGCQFTLDYDTNALDFLSITVGSSCDASSPYATDIFRDADESAGRIFYGVGVQLGQNGSPGPVALACATFLPRELGESEVCLLAQSEVQATLLANPDGERVLISNAQDCPGSDEEPFLSCATVEVTEKCACSAGGVECEGLNTTCRSGVCDEQIGVCRLVSVNENAPCDDGDACTTDEVCRSGKCLGTDCTDPSLCVVKDDCAISNAAGKVVVKLGLGESLVAAGQFSLQYDPNALEFVSIAPGNTCDPSSPFNTEVSRKIDAFAGTIFYAVAVGLTKTPTSGPAAMACAEFRVLDRAGAELCSFTDINPFQTELVDEHGQRVGIFNLQACPTDKPFPITSCVQFDFCEIPAVSHWGLVIVALGLATAAKVTARAARRRTR